MRNGLTPNEISSAQVDVGVHPSNEGYKKIGNLWFDGLAQKVGTANGGYAIDRDTLINVENLAGSSFDDVLTGNTAANIIAGGQGRDRLMGGGGADVFNYRSFAEGGDLITDFGPDDSFRISASEFGGGLIGGIGLSATAADAGVLVNGATPISADPTFLYHEGTLRFDVDGQGSAGTAVIATLGNRPAALNPGQFQIVA
jgi:Ca2+-binding RTX toxin-like protein